MVKTLPNLRRFAPHREIGGTNLHSRGTNAAVSHEWQLLGREQGANFGT
jgi:hypothetical protein